MLRPMRRVKHQAVVGVERAAAVAVARVVGKNVKTMNLSRMNRRQHQVLARSLKIWSQLRTSQVAKGKPSQVRPIRTNLLRSPESRRKHMS